MRSILLFALYILSTTAVQARTCPDPSQPIRLVLALPAGGTNLGLLGLWLRDKLETQSIKLIIDPQPGASGMRAGEFIKRSDPDGCTVVVMPSTFVTIVPHLHHKMPYDPRIDIVPVVEAFRFSFVLAVGSASPVQTVSDLVALARAQPGKVTYGTFGEVGGQRLAAELLASMTGVQMTNVPYGNANGNTQFVIDAAENRLTAVFTATQTLAPFVAAGKMRPVAVTGSARSQLFSNVPTIGESIPGYAVNVSMVLFAPKGTPQEAIAFLNRTVTELLSSPDLSAKLRSQDVQFVPNTPEEVRQTLRDEYATYGKIIQKAGIKLE
jgi:tripartite-type tricarboxylate transporter receptor subunit TctC